MALCQESCSINGLSAHPLFYWNYDRYDHTKKRYDNTENSIIVTVKPSANLARICQWGLYTLYLMISSHTIQN